VADRHAQAAAVAGAAVRAARIRAGAGGKSGAVPDLLEQRPDHLPQHGAGHAVVTTPS
jgi:hypothetical protein